MNLHTLTELQYSPRLDGPFLLYLFHATGYHSGAKWFAKTIRYPEEQISIDAARKLAEAHIAKGLEVRITDAGDQLVYHSDSGEQLYPAKEIDFWAAIGGGE